MNENLVKEYLSPDFVSQYNNLELIARMVVEGYLTGLHSSPFHGFSAEFSQHRPYMDGDNLRFIDWKVFGRTGRYYIKQFKEETNLRCYILLDISQSMQYGSGKITKSKYASYLAAALTYLMIKQRDATGLILFDDQIRTFMPPRPVSSYITPILETIDNARYGSDTSVGKVLHDMADRIHKRSLLIIISDLLDNPEEIIAGVNHMRYNKHEALVFHIMDQTELNFDFSGDIIFEDLESGETIKTQPQYIHSQYQKHIETYLNYLKVNFSNNKIDYQLLNTETPFYVALNEFLLKRMRLY